MQTVALLNVAGPDGAKAGLALGTVTSVGLLGLYAKRTLDTGSFLPTACAQQLLQLALHVKCIVDIGSVCHHSMYAAAMSVGL